MKNKEVRIGQLGLGNWGKNILRNLYELGVVKIACDANPQTVANREKEFPNLKFTTNQSEILNNPEIDAIAIATPAATHYKVAKECLLAGKHVFVEKPLSLRVKEGLELLKIAEEKKCILMVGHVLQYHPAVTKLKQLVTSGELGKVHYISSNRLNIGHLRTEENILWSFAPHDISVILSLFGENPTRLAAVGGDYLNRGVQDITLSTLEFKNGSKAHIFVSWLHPFKEQKLVVVGSKAMVVFDDTTKEKLFIYRHEIDWKDGKIPVVNKANAEAIEVPPGEPLRMEMEHFVECIREGKQPRTDGYEAIKVLKIIQALEESMNNQIWLEVHGTVELEDHDHQVVYL